MSFVKPLVMCLCAGIGIASAACGPAARNGVSPRPVSLAEFAGTQPPVTSLERDPASSGVDEVEDPQTPMVWFDEFEQRMILVPEQPGHPVIVDSLVGHVNGRPIFADEFLEPIEDHLMRVAEQKRGPELEMEFMRIINEWLREVVQNELILAEAQASLSEQEQLGLFAWLRRTYEEEIRKGGGTRSGAQSRRLSEGEELDQYLDRQKDFVLIEQLRRDKIEPRVIVSWRDIEREYQRYYDEFNPPGTVTLALIRLSSKKQGPLIEDVTQRLAAGEPFADVAEELGFSDGGTWETFQIGPGGLNDIEVRDEMKAALEGLEVGDTTTPFLLGSSTVWLNVVEVTSPIARSIYDPQVQLALRNSIINRRRYIEWTRYVNSLVETGVHDDLDEMATRLFRIALLRYAL